MLGRLIGARRRAVALACGSLLATTVAITGAVPTAAVTGPAPIGPRTVVGGGWGDGGPATQARLASTSVGLALLPDGELIYHEYQSNSIQRVDGTGTVSCVADCSHTPGYSGDGGPASDARLSGTFAMAPAPDGALYVADADNNRLRRIGTDGVITTVAGTGAQTSWVASGPALSTQVTPTAVAVAPDGTVYFADKGTTNGDGHGGVTVRRLTGGQITTVLGGAAAGGAYSGWDSTWDGHPATDVHLGYVASLVLGTAPTGGDVLVGATDSGRVLRLASNGIVTTVAGDGAGPWPSSGDGALATAAHFQGLGGLVVESDGSLDVTDAEGIRHIVVGGDVTLLHAGVTGVGLAVHGSTFYTVAGIAATDYRDTAIVATAADGTQTMVVGAKPAAVGDGGPLKDAWFRFAADTALLPDGSIVVSQSLGTLRRVGTDGIVHTIAGSSLYPTTFSGEGGAATAAVIPGPKELAVDAAGDIFVACSDSTVREILASDGTIHTVLGTGTAWTSTPTLGPVAASSMALGDIRSLSVAPDGVLWVVDAAAGSPYGARLVTLGADGTTAQQVTQLTLPAVSGTAAVGAPLGSLGQVDAAGVSPTGDLVLVDADGWEYRSTDRSTIASVRRGIGYGVSHVRFDPAGDVVLSFSAVAIRFLADGSTDTLSNGLIDVGADGPRGVSVSATAVTYLTGQGLIQRVIPNQVARPSMPTAALGPVPGSSHLGIHLTSPLPAGQTLTGFGYLGTPSPVVQPVGFTGFSPYPHGDLPMSVPEGFGGKTVTGVVWVYDAVTGETSVPRTITYAERSPVTCPVSPASRTVAYGATVTSTAVVSSYEPNRQVGVPGSWTVAPGGLAATHATAVATTSLGATSRATRILRTTAITYSVTPGEWTACATKVTYSVAGTLKAVPNLTSARRGAALRITATLTPHVAGQRITLQRLVGTRWVSLAASITPSSGVVAFATKAPTSKGYASYRVVSTTSSALVGAVSAATRVRVV